MRLPFVVLAVVPLAGCFHTTPPEQATPRSAMSVAASFGKTWDATIDEFAERGISIETLDRPSGLIVPAGRQYVRADISRLLGLADCGKDSGAPVLPTDVKYNVVVRGDSVQSTVQVRAFYRSEHAQFECVSRGVFEEATEAAIKSRAEGKRPASAPPSDRASESSCTDTARRDGPDYRVTLRRLTSGTCTAILCTIRGAASRGTPEDAIALCKLDHSLWERPD